MFWCLNVRVTPVLIPNTEVKPHSADGSRKARVGRRQNIVLNNGQFFSSTGLSSVVPMVVVRQE
jgi:hypothetical protein